MTAGKEVHACQPLRCQPRFTTQAVESECFFISTRQNNVGIFSAGVVFESDKRKNRYKTRKGEKNLADTVRLVCH